MRMYWQRHAGFARNLLSSYRARARSVALTALLHPMRPMRRVASSPLTGITVLEHVDFVMKGGVVFERPPFVVDR